MAFFRLKKESDEIKKNNKFMARLLLLYAALYGGYRLISSEIEHDREFRNQRKAIYEHGQLIELGRQMDSIKEADDFIVAEEKRIKEEQILAEAEVIEEYYELTQDILDHNVYIDTVQNYDDQRRVECDKNYGDAIEEIAPKFGLSPNVVKCIACLEGGGYLENVMQASTGWQEQKLDFYDYDTNRWRKICVTSYPKESTVDCLYIPTSDPAWSVYLGCTIFQKGIQYNKGHFFATFRYYNSGDSAPLVQRLANDQGIKADEYLDDKYNADIQYYEYNAYTQYVLQFMDDNPIEYNYYNDETNRIEKYVMYMTYANRDIEEVIIDEVGEEPTCEFPENEELLASNSENLTKEINKARKK